MRLPNNRTAKVSSFPNIFISSPFVGVHPDASEFFLHNHHAILIMSDRCDVFYFLCPNCKRTAAVPESFRYALMCAYCNCEMKPIITQD
jgi:hypothetical protein